MDNAPHAVPPAPPSTDPTGATNRVSVALTVTANAVGGVGGELPVAPDDVLARDLLLLLLREAAGVPLDQALAICGYHSRATYYAKLRRFRKGGLAALAASKPGPHSSWRRSESVNKRIVALRMRNPSFSAERIAAMLARDGAEISVRSVERTLAEFGLSRERGR